MDDLNKAAMFMLNYQNLMAAALAAQASASSGTASNGSNSGAASPPGSVHSDQPSPVPAENQNNNTMKTYQDFLKNFQNPQSLNGLNFGVPNGNSVDPSQFAAMLMAQSKGASAMTQMPNADQVSI